MTREAMKTVRIKLSEAQAAARRRPPGYLEELMASSVGSEDGMLVFTESQYRALLAKYSQQASPAGGPGTELKALLGLLGIHSTPTCHCNAHAREMDHWGPDECERRMDEIVGRLREQAVARKLPFSAVVAKQLVRLAIRRARRKANAEAHDAGK